MVTLKSHFRTGAQFRDRYLNDAVNGGLFIPTTRSLAVGDKVIVAAQIGSRAGPILWRGRITARRSRRLSAPDGRLKSRAGVDVEFLPSETSARDYLLALADETPPARPTPWR